MVTKSFGIYREGGERILATDNLSIEVGKSHIAFILVNTEANSIVGFELFTFEENDSLPEKLFTDIGNTSHFLSKLYSEVNVYINNEFCVPIPFAKFAHNTTADFVELLFGEAENESLHHDRLNKPLDIVNAYRISQSLEYVLNHYYPYYQLHHSWTNMLQTLSNKNMLSISALIYVQFYNTYFTVVVGKKGMLQLVQTYIYETPEDVLYQLLNVAIQCDIAAAEMELHICGLVDPNYKLFRELTNYFKTIITDKPDMAKASIDLGAYPHHYFTPFFNLAL